MKVRSLNMPIKRKKFKKILWAGKDIESGLIAFNWMYNSRIEALLKFKDYENYEIVKVKLKEI